MKIKKAISLIFNDNNTLAITDIQKSTAFRKYLEITFKNYSNTQQNLSRINKVNKFLSSPSLMVFPTKLLYFSETKNYCQKIT